jgi:hypothetical protein
MEGNTNRVGSTHSAETKAAIGAANSEALKGNTNRALSVYVYDQDNVLVDSFPSHTAAAAFLGCTKQRVSQLVQAGGRTRKGFRVTTTPLA